MSRQTFNIGTGPNSGNGDPIRTAFTKVEENFGELYAHANSTSNPHNITVEQIGAQPLSANLTSFSTLSATGLASHLGGNIWAIRQIGVQAATSIPDRAAGDSRWLTLTGGTLTGTLVLAADPVNDLSPTTKRYVDALIQGLSPKNAVRVASIGNLTLSGLQTIDGVSISIGDRILVKNQSLPRENGIYVVASGSWTRALDMDVWTEVPSSYVFVTSGTAGGSTGWLVTSATTSGTINTTDMNWSQFSGTGTYTASNGIIRSGSDFQLTGQALALHNLAISGLIVRTGAGAVTSRAIVAPAAGISVTNGDGIAGNPTLVLTNDLAGVEGISTTGFVRRTGVDTWSATSLTNSEITTALGYTPWHPGNDGAGSGLDADTLDGLTSTQFLRKDVLDYKTGHLQFNNQHEGLVFPFVNSTTTPTYTAATVITGGKDVAGLAEINNINITTWNGFSVSTAFGSGTVPQYGVAFSVNARSGIISAYGQYYANGALVWNANNDGAGSGLDADLLDGQQGVFYQNASNLTLGTLSTARLPALSGDVSLPLGGSVLTLATVNSNVGTYGNSTHLPSVIVNGKGLTTGVSPVLITPAWGSVTSKPTTLVGYSITAADVLATILTVDGAASGLDADLLDGQDGLFYQNAENLTAGTISSARFPSLTGDVSLPQGNSVLTLATVNSNIGTFGNATVLPSFVVNGKGLITSVSNIVVTPAWGSVTGKPTTLSGYNITASDILATISNVDGILSGLDADLLDGQTGLFYQNATNISNGTLSASRLPALTGDVSLATGGSTLTLATVNSNVGTFGNATHVPSVILNGKGLATGASMILATPAWGSVTSKPTTLGGYGITDAAPRAIGSLAGSVLATDLRTITNPTTGLGYFGGVRFRFSGMNDTNAPPYADVIDFSTYTDPSGGGFNALYLSKSSHQIFHKFAIANATTWTTKTIAYTDSNITGSAATLTTPRTFEITGDLVWTSPAFNGSANVTAAGTLATVNSNVGAFGNATHVGAFTVNAKGLTTAASAVLVTPAWASVTGKPTSLTEYGFSDVYDFVAELNAFDPLKSYFAPTAIDFTANNSRWNSSMMVPTAIPGWTFTRTDTSCTPTALDSAAALVQFPPRTNLLLRSQEFDNTSWIKSNTTVIANTVFAPDGTMTADRIEATGTSSIAFQQSVVVTATSATASVFAKKGTGATRANYFRLRNATTALNLLEVTVNYDTGAVTYITGSSGVSVQLLSDGWIRVLMSASAGITSGDSLRFDILSSSTSSTTGEFAFAWGAQLETGTSATAYIPTTTTAVTVFPPRITTRGLLVEEARTNLFLYSTNTSDAFWTATSATKTSTTATAPDGTSTAASYLTSSTSGRFRSPSITTANASVYTGSLYVKNIDGVLSSIGIYDGALFAGRVTVNWTGTTLTSLTIGSNPPIAYGFDPAGNDWYRVWLTVTSTSVVEQLMYYPDSLAIGRSALVWGGQFELGSFPTSLMVTTATTGTRNADRPSTLLTLPQTQNFSLFVEVEFLGSMTQSQRLFECHDGTDNNRLFIERGSDGTLTLYAIIAGATTTSVISNRPGARTLRAAISRTGTILTAVVDGLTPVTLSSTGMVALTGLQLAGRQASSTATLNSYLKRFAHYPHALPNSQLIDITK